MGITTVIIKPTLISWEVGIDEGDEKRIGISTNLSGTVHTHIHTQWKKFIEVLRVYLISKGKKIF